MGPKFEELRAEALQIRISGSLCGTRWPLAGRIAENQLDAENFAELGNVAQYQTTIEEIESLTNLDFGHLREHDTFLGAGETFDGKLRIESFESLRLKPQDIGRKRGRR